MFDKRLPLNALIALTCIFSSPSTLASEVEMIKTTGYCVTRTGCFERAEVKLKNIAFTKILTMNMEKYDGDTDTYRCTFKHLIAAGAEELWECDSFNTSNTSYESFTFEYKVAGSTFTDTNNGSGYPTGTTHDVILGQSTDVKLAYTSTQQDTLYFDIHVKAQGVPTEIDIIYTHDNWLSTRIVDANNTNNIPSFSHWFRSQIPWGANSSVEFAIRMRAGGNESWDNNFGLNYFVSK